MGKQLYKVLTLMCLLLVSGSKSQTYPFANYTIEDGISSGQVLSAFQNDDGVMWFGTSGGGITIYDGKFFEYLTVKDGLADNVVFCIRKDKKGKILIGTNNGLSVYDPSIHTVSKKDRFKNYTTKNGLSHDRVFSIIFDENDVAILATGRGVSTFHDTICQKLKINPKLDTCNIFRVVKDSEKNLWCSTLGGGVFKYDGNITHNYTTRDGLANDYVFSVMEVAHNTIWFFTGEGLFEFNDGKFGRLNPAEIDTTATYYDGYKDKNGSIWLGTSNGLIKQKPDGTVTLFKKFNGLVDNSIWGIFQDRESNMWFISDQNGISRLASERFYLFSVKDSLYAEEIKAIDQSSTGEYWLGTKRGLSKLKGKKVRNYNNVALANGNSDLWAITHDDKGTFYIGSTNGLLITQGESFKRINARDKDSPLNAIFNILIDNKNELWLGTQGGVATLKDGFLIPRTEPGIPTVFTNKIVQDEKGNYWICTDNGLYMYNGKTVKHYSEDDGLPECRVKSIVFDDNNNFWLATDKGVLVSENGKFSNITNKLDLPSNEVYSLLKDHNKHLWAGLSIGTARINMDGEHKVRLYVGDDGFLGQACNQNAILFDRNDRICIGGTKGLVIYEQQYDHDNTLEPITKIKSIHLFSEERTNWDEYADTVSAGDIPYNLELPYNKNYLTFNFIGVSLTAPGKVSYKFMLKGFDSDWRFSNKNDALYSNLPPGNYEFLLYANNGEGVWNREPVSFKFVIDPPFWRTWWFYGLIAAIILTGIYSYVKIRAANVKIMKQSLIIDKKNETLQHLNLEIAEKNQNITDSINYAKRIQRSFITSDKVINKLLGEHFILFKPRDIVSGDFYLAFEMHDRTLVVCADCTGHGIPGAFMSLVGISILNEISRSRTYIDTTEILDEIRRIIIEALNPERSETGGKDGMDVSLVSIFKKPESDGMIKIHFSGANNSACLVSAKEGKVKMYEYRGDKQPVGYYSSMKPFTHHEIMAQKGDIIYMFTDGYADQFGGPRGRKFMSSQLKAQIVAMFDKPLAEQKEVLDRLFIEWQGDLEQIDDVTVIGIKL